jgi:hypothetical protein
MALPKLSYPIYDLVIPSTKQEIKYRPFLVKEEKLLLMAQSGKETTEIINSIKQVINNCIVTEGVDVEKFSSFDLEYFFIKLRSKSIGNVITITYRDLDDNKKYDVEVNLDDVVVVEPENHCNDIKITETIGMKLRHPTPSVASLIDGSKGSEVVFDIVCACIESIYDGNEVFDASEHTKEELDEFVSQLSVEVFEKIQGFFETMPKLHYEVKYTNSEGNEKTITLSTLSDFFTLG